MKPEFYSWTARVICMLAIAFVMMFSADCFGGNVKLSEQLLCFFMHNIPSFILIIWLLIAWKWEFIGGLTFVFMGLLASLFVFNLNYNRNHSVWMSLSIILMITFPFVVVGILFLVSDWLKKKQAANKASG